MRLRYMALHELLCIMTTGATIGIHSARRASSSRINFLTSQVGSGGTVMPTVRLTCFFLLNITQILLTIMMKIMTVMIVVQYCISIYLVIPALLQRSCI